MWYSRLFKILICLVALLTVAACTQTDPFDDVMHEDMIIWAGGTYSGDLSNALPHGRGLWIHPDGYYYDGEWEFGLKSGFGELLTLGGDSYEGLWQDDLQHGYGKYFGRDGIAYEGEWVEGLFEGRGAWRNKQGDTYTGEFKDGLFHGEGLWVSYNGDKYYGKFAEGKKHGEGIYTKKDGISLEGIWIEGVNSELEATLAAMEASLQDAAPSTTAGGFKVTGLRFFSSDKGLGRTRFRNYSTTFNSNVEQFIFWELEIAIPKHSIDRNFVITSQLKPFGSWDTDSYNVPEGYDTYRLAGPQTSKYHLLPRGNYTMEIRLGDREGRVIATGNFVID